MWWWVGHVLGLDDPSGAFYLWWSGFGTNLGLLGAAWAIIRKHQCHVGRCWRVARYQAGDFRVCRAHHPDLDAAPTHADVAEHLERRR